jgi:N-acetylneuraminic acid mutarotase
VTYDSETGNSYLYINDELNYNVNGVKESIPLHIDKKLKTQDSVKPILLGVCTLTGVFLKGKIAEVKIYNKFFEDVNSIFEDNNDLVLHYNFNVSDKDLVNEYELYNNNTIFVNEDIEVKDLVLHYRRECSFDCIYHDDEGYVNGKWAKGETTARNERRFVTEMQQKKINYKEEGYNKILDVTELINIDEALYPNTRFINVIMK